MSLIQTEDRAWVASANPRVRLKEDQHLTYSLASPLAEGTCKPKPKSRVSIQSSANCLHGLKPTVVYHWIPNARQNCTEDMGRTSTGKDPTDKQVRKILQPPQVVPCSLGLVSTWHGRRKSIYPVAKPTMDKMERTQCAPTELSSPCPGPLSGGHLLLYLSKHK